MYEWFGILGGLLGVLVGWYLSNLTQKRLLKISELRNELEKAYGPLYNIVSRPERAGESLRGEKGLVVIIPNEEKEMLDKIMITYPHIFSIEIVVNWRVNIRELKPFSDKGKLFWSIPVDFKNQIIDEYDRRRMEYLEMTGRAEELKKLPKLVRV